MTIAATCTSLSLKTHIILHSIICTYVYTHCIRDFTCTCIHYVSDAIESLHLPDKESSVPLPVLLES